MRNWIRSTFLHNFSVFAIFRSKVCKRCLNDLRDRNPTELDIDIPVQSDDIDDPVNTSSSSFGSQEREIQQEGLNETLVCLGETPIKRKSKLTLSYLRHKCFLFTNNSFAFSSIRIVHRVAPDTDLPDIRPPDIWKNSNIEFS